MRRGRGGAGGAQEQARFQLMELQSPCGLCVGRLSVSFVQGSLLAVGPSAAWLCSYADGSPLPGSTREGVAFVRGQKEH